MIYFLQSQQQAPMWAPWILPIGLFAVFYFMILRPQQKRQREHRAMLDSLKKGDRVITSGGIYGVVVALKDDVVVLRIAENCNVEITRPNVAAIVP